MSDNYDTDPEDAIGTVLDEDERDTCATIQVTNSEETFVVEYLNHPEDDQPVFNVTTDSLPDGVGVTEAPGVTIVDTTADTVATVHHEVVELARLAASDDGFTLAGAKTKPVPPSDWEPRFRDALSYFGQWLNPFSDPPRP